MTPEELKQVWMNVDCKYSESAKQEHIEFLKYCQDIGIINENNLTLNNLTIENYASNLEISGHGYFPNWIESKTSTFGKYGGTAGKHGLYVTSDSNNQNIVYKNYLNKIIPSTDAQKIFDRIKDILGGVASLNNVNCAPLSQMYCAKIAFLFNPQKILPVWNLSSIRKISDFFNLGIADTQDYLASTEVMEYLKINGWINFPETENPSESASKNKILADFLMKNIANIELINNNIIYYGPPGTGKTYTVESRLKSLKMHNIADYEIIQFHPSYSYEDFLEGWKPEISNGQVTLRLKPGRFKLFCKRAGDALKEARKTKKEPKIYYFVIDEINRAELSRVFGDVLVCIEKTKRFDYDSEGNLTPDSFCIQSTLGFEDTVENAVIWMSERAYFGVPKNVYIIGTMNDTDRSIDAFDLALRRRFIWTRMGCDYDVIKDTFPEIDDGDDYSLRCNKLNDLLTDTWGLGMSYELGHAYFIKDDPSERYTSTFREKIFRDRISPLLNEYLRAFYSEPEIKGKLKEVKQLFVDQ